MVTVQTRGKFLKMFPQLKRTAECEYSSFGCHRIKEVLITLVGLSIFLMLSLISHHPADQGWSNVDSTGHAVHNLKDLLALVFRLDHSFIWLFFFFNTCFCCRLGWGIYRDKINHIIENKFFLV